MASAIAHMGRAYLAIALAVAFMLHSISLADDATTIPSANTASGLALIPGPEITLNPGEHVPLIIFDPDHKPVQVSKISWTIDGQSVSQADAAAGSLDVPDDNPYSTSTIYTAPAQAPARSTIELTASVATSDPPVTLTTKVTIIKDPNWFTVDGDTGFGKKSVAIQLRDKLPSGGGVYTGPIKLLANQFFIRIYGFDKLDSNSGVYALFNLGNDTNNQPGTYIWQAGQNAREVQINYGKKGFGSTKADSAGNVTSLDGSTTLLEPDPADKSGLVKGFFSGNMFWAEMQKPQLIRGRYVLNFRFHYVTMHGHFAVPKATE
jgi:hypothetical protein